MTRAIIILCLLSIQGMSLAQGADSATRLVEVAKGWSANSVNTVIFRKNSVVTAGDTQFIAFYDKDQYVTIGKRKLESDHWQIERTVYRGNARDAHNCISLMVDGKRFLHLAWDHHGNALHYARSVSPGSLSLTGVLPMTGLNEENVTYPEFYHLPDGDLVFLYRDGSSGKGNLVVNKYDVEERQWTQLHANLIDGENERNAYWQACVDAYGVIHISWVWRESPDVASNHDLCYARSSDGGVTWEKSSREIYSLPITAKSAEYIVRIPEGSELINQTSMCTDPGGRPIIASYWCEANTNIPQYHVAYLHGDSWVIKNLAFRKTSFSLRGAGTKRIPISRPQVLAWGTDQDLRIALIFRDEERNGKVSVAVSNDVPGNQWRILDLTKFSMGSWEPTYDTELWRKTGEVNIFLEHVDQADSEQLTKADPQMIQVLEWKAFFKLKLN